MDFLHVSKQSVHNAVCQPFSTAFLLVLILRFAMMMDVTPGSLADIAEMIAACANHMVTSLIFLDEHETVRASFPIFEVLLEIF